jgi:uncharacterized protein (TIGR03435 family)
MRSDKIEGCGLSLYRLMVVGVVGSGLWGMPLTGQILHAGGPLPSFEVATIKQQKIQAAPPPPGEAIVHSESFRGPAPGASRPPSDRVHVFLTTRMLISSAYNFPLLSQSRIVGGPDWLDSNRYEIEGKIDDSLNATLQAMAPAKRWEQIQLMEQSLLADRFKLKVHFETKEMTVLALVVAKGGSKLTPAKDGEQTTISVLGNPQGSEMKAQAATLDQLVNGPTMSANPATGGRVVVDQTGLTGTYDFTLKWGPEQTAAAGQESIAVDPPLLAAIQQQLGLKLVETKGPVEVLVIDHVELPSEN